MPSENESRITRRHAIGRVGAAGAASPIVLALGCESLAEALGIETSPTASASASAPLSDEAHRLRHEDWASMIGDSFVVEDSPFHDSTQGDGTKIALLQTFDETIADDDARPDHLREGAISLLFVAEPRIQMPNATYLLQHPKLGRFHLFLHQIPRDDHRNKRIYEAVIN